MAESSQEGRPLDLSGGLPPPRQGMALSDHMDTPRISSSTDDHPRDLTFDIEHMLATERQVMMQKNSQCRTVDTTPSFDEVLNFRASASTEEPGKPPPRVPLTDYAMASKFKGPLCKVCNDEASGFHYGVDSCEGCKGFFRRCITQGMTHRCNNEEKCEITPFSRNSCQYCRLKKCFMVGMSREASRLGRRPKRLKEAMAMEYSKSYYNDRSPTSDVLAMPPILPLAQISQVTGLTEEQLRDMTMGDLQNLLQKINSQRSHRGLSSQQSIPSSSGALPPQQVSPHHSSYMRQTSSSSSSHTSPGRVPDHENPDTSFTNSSYKPHTDASGRMKSESRSSLPDNPNSVESESGYSSYEAGSDTPSSQPSSSPVMVPCGFNVNKVKIEVEDANCSLKKFKTSCRESRCPQTPTSAPSSYLDCSDKSWENADACAVMQRKKTPASTGYIPYDAQDSPRIPDVQPPSVSSRYSPASIDHSPLSWQSPPDSPSPVTRLYDQASEMGPVKKRKTSTETSFLTMINEGEVASNFTTKSMDTKQVTEISINAQTPPSAERMKLIDQVIDMVVEAHLDTCNYTSEKVSKAMEDYRNKCADGKEPAPMDEVPGGAMLTWCSQFVANMAPVILRVVKFCKRLPGFRELAEDDQIRLIKQGSFEVMLVRYTVLFQEDQMFVPSMTFKVSRSLITAMPLGDFFDQQFLFANVFNKLELTDAETALFTAILIFNSNRLDLSNPLAVKMMQALLAQAFYAYLIRSRGENGHAHFLKVIDIMPLLWGINEVHSKCLNDMKVKMPEMMNQFPNIHKEMFNS